MNFIKENEIIEGESWPLDLSRDVSTKITLTFHYHSHHLVTITKWAVRVTDIYYEGIHKYVGRASSPQKGRELLTDI